MFISFENPPLLNLTSLSLVAAFFAVAFPSFGLAQVFFSLFPLRIMVLNWQRRAAKPFHTGGATEKVDLINCQFVHNYFVLWKEPAQLDHLLCIIKNCPLFKIKNLGQIPGLRKVKLKTLLCKVALETCKQPPLPWYSFKKQIDFIWKLTSSCHCQLMFQFIDISSNDRFLLQFQEAQLKNYKKLLPPP